MDQLLHQIISARYRALRGLTETPIRIGIRILEIINKNKNLANSTEKQKILNQVAVVFLECYSEDGIKKVHSIYQTIGQTDPKQKAYFDLLYLQFLIFSGKINYSKATQLQFKNLLMAFERDPLLFPAIQYHMILNQFLFKKVSDSKIESLINEKYAHSYESLRLSYQILKFKLEVRNAKKIKNMNRKKFSPSIYHQFEIHFLLKNYSNKKLSLSENIFLCCYPKFNEYSQIMGNQYNFENQKVSQTFLNHLPGLKSQYYKNQNLFFWKISSKSISATNYTKANLKGNLLDLASGLLKKDTSIINLGKKRTQALMTIIGSGSEGATDLLLSEKIYFEEKVSISVLLQRSQDLVTNLIKIGFPIYRKDEKIFFDFSKFKVRILLPKNHIYRGPLLYLALQKKLISRNQITYCLSVSKRTASYYLKEWISEGHILPVEKKYGSFIPTADWLKTNV